ncbi:MAG: hypothetical protein LBL74_01785 [Bacteroidales bacterium]|jgi:hypothetical protein|nr:hypothetical protein [Bacteroidales bacterium]
MRKLFIILVFCLPFIASAQNDTLYVLNGKTIEINDLGKNSDGRITLSLKTIKQDSIRLSFQAFTAKESAARWAARLQYRVGESGKWKDVPNQRQRAVEFTSSRYPTSRDFKVVLPEDCNDKELVQVSWRIYRLKGKGADPGLGISSVDLISNNDSFLQDPQIFIENKDDGTDVGDNIVFNHIALPYTYPDARRLKIYGLFLRGNINLELEGKDADNFVLDRKAVHPDSAANETVTIYYTPKKAGTHAVQLLLKTKKLSYPIAIKLLASADSVYPLGENKTKNTIISITKTPDGDFKGEFEASVFSNRRYLFKFNLINDHFNPINVRYQWFRDGRYISETTDKVVQQKYRKYLLSPGYANNVKIIFETNKKAVLYNVYFGSPEVKTMIKSGKWSDESNWINRDMPVDVSDFVKISDGIKVKVTEDAFCSNLILGDKSNVSIQTGKTFCVADNIIYGKDAYFSVSQFLPAKQWNYISPAVNRIKAYTFSMRRDDNETWLMEYNTGIISEQGDHWSPYITDPNFILKAGQGYAVYTQKSINVMYDGILSNSQVTIPLVSQNKDRWNFIGNPFTAPLDSRKLFSCINGKIQGNAIFIPDSNGFYNPIIIDSFSSKTIIPSLSAFFVESLKSNSEITFKRSQQYTGDSIVYEEQRPDCLSLFVAKTSATSDFKPIFNRSIIKFNNYAKNGFDDYDAHKLFGSSNNPEIYTIIGNEELAINTFSHYPVVLGLGLYAPAASTIAMGIDNLSSITSEDVIIFLEDTKHNEFQNICTNASLNTWINKGTTADKYRIHLVNALKIPGESNISDIYLWTDNGRVLVYDGGILLDKIIVRKDNKVIAEKIYRNDFSNVPSAKVIEINNKEIDKNCVIDLVINGITYRDFYLDI